MLTQDIGVVSGGAAAAALERIVQYRVAEKKLLKKIDFKGFVGPKVSKVSSHSTLQIINITDDFVEQMRRSFYLAASISWWSMAT